VPIEGVDGGYKPSGDEAFMNARIADSESPPLGAATLGSRSLIAINCGGFDIERQFAPALRRAPLIWKQTPNAERYGFCTATH